MSRTIEEIEEDLEERLDNEEFCDNEEYYDLLWEACDAYSGRVGAVRETIASARQQIGNTVTWRRQTGMKQATDTSEFSGFGGCDLIALERLLDRLERDLE